MTPPLPCVATPLNMLITTCGAHRITFDFQSRPVGCDHEQTPGFRIITVQGFSHESRTGQGKICSCFRFQRSGTTWREPLHAPCQYMNLLGHHLKKNFPKVVTWIRVGEKKTCGKKKPDSS